MGGVDRDGEAYLALDTGSPIVSAAVAVDGVVVTERTVEIARSSERIAGSYADNLNWGQEAATRSANRVAIAIDKA